MMKKTPFIALILGLFITACGTTSDVAEPQAEKILGEILAARDAIRTISATPPIFVTFWDFDGTIILGDCTLGHEENGVKAYRGLAEEAITRGLSGKFGKDGYSDFAKAFLRMESRGNHGEAEVYIARIFSGTKIDDLLGLSRGHFSAMSPYYFASSMHIIQRLRREEIGVYVLSASPEFFVDGAAATTGIPEAKIFGIRTALKDGRVTGKILEPATYGIGKVKMLLEILARLRKEHEGRAIYVLAGFGNSYHTDGEFLGWIAQQRLPASKPVAVMINGGKAPARYAGMFTTVLQSKTMGEASRTR